MLSKSIGNTLGMNQTFSLVLIMLIDVRLDLQVQLVPGGFGMSRNVLADCDIVVHFSLLEVSY